MAVNQVHKLIFLEHTAKIHPASNIYVVNGTMGYDNGFNELIDLMDRQGLPFYKSTVEGKHQGSEGLIAKNDIVIIKINSQWDKRGGTNTDLLMAVIEAITKHPDDFIGEIVVADNGQGRGSLRWEYNNAKNPSQSAQRVVDRFNGPFKVSTYLWDDIGQKSVKEYSDDDLEDGYIVNQTANPSTGIMVSYPKFKTAYDTYISFKRGVWNPETKAYENERLKVINIPVLKTHKLYGVTACVKHYMGVVSRHLTNAHEKVSTGGMGTEMVETRMPIFNLLDAIWVNATPRNGPDTSYSEAVRVNVIAASKDPVALDYWAAKRILMKAARVKDMSVLRSLDPDATTSDSFGKWLRLSMLEIQKAGYQTTASEDRINIEVVNLSKNLETNKNA